MEATTRYFEIRNKEKNLERLIKELDEAKKKSDDEKSAS